MSMRYEHIRSLTQEEIGETIKSSPSDGTVIRAVLAAIHHHDTMFAGETLLECLRSATGERRLALMRMVHTFLQMHRTDFLVPQFLAEMKAEDRGVPASAHPEVSDLTDGLLEFEDMFRGQSARLRR